MGEEKRVEEKVCGGGTVAPDGVYLYLKPFIFLVECFLRHYYSGSTSRDPMCLLPWLNHTFFIHIIFILSFRVRCRRLASAGLTLMTRLVQPFDSCCRHGRFALVRVFYY